MPSDNGRCVKLNQCTASEETLDPECTCERCACHDLPGAASYQYVHSLCSMSIHIHRPFLSFNVFKALIQSCMHSCLIETSSTRGGRGVGGWGGVVRDAEVGLKE